MRSLKFLGELDHFYFSKFADNTSEPLRTFFTKRYFEDKVGIFDDSGDEINRFRLAAAEKLKNLTDRQLRTIIETSASRVRIWSFIGSLKQAEIEKAVIVATLDSRTTELCRALDGKIFRVDVAAAAIQELNKLQPGDFALRMYESGIGKAISRDPVETITAFLEEDGKTIGDEIVKQGRGFPPYHPNCRTRIEGLIKGVDEDA